MEIGKIIDQLKSFGITRAKGCDTPTYIQTHKMLPPGATSFFHACLYVGYVSQLPERLVDSDRASLICICDQSLPPDFIDSGEMNLYLMPPEADQFDVLNKIADILIDEAWITASMRRILDELYLGTGLQAIVDVAADAFGNPIFVNDISFKILAMTRGITYENEQLEAQKDLGYIHPKIVEAMRADDVDFEMSGRPGRAIKTVNQRTGDEWLFCGIRLHDIQMGFIGIPALNHPHRPRDIELLERLAKIIAVELEKDDFYRDSRGAKFGYLLSDLLSGKVQSRRTIEQRAMSIGWTLREWTRIVTVVDPGGYIPPERVHQIAERVQRIVRGARWTTFKHNIVFFVNRDGRAVTSERECAELEGFLAGSKLAAGVSMPFQDLLDATRYYRQSIRAVDAAILARRDGSLFYYSNLLTYYAAQSLLKRNDANEFCPESVLQVREYDARHGTDLCETLEQYLLHVGDPVAAAKALHVHRNTLLYRINKVRELTGMDLTDGNERFAAQLYFRLAECQHLALQMEGR